MSVKPEPNDEQNPSRCLELSVSAESRRRQPLPTTVAVGIHSFFRLRMQPRLPCPPSNRPCDSDVRLDPSTPDAFAKTSSAAPKSDERQVNPQSLYLRVDQRTRDSYRYRSLGWLVLIHEQLI